jgi:hypothetical protein
MIDTVDLIALEKIVQKAKKLAKEFRRITGKPLGITGEVGEFIAADLLNLELMVARNPGFDAVGSDGRHIQIKSRCILPNSKPGQRVGSIRLIHEFDTVMLVLMNEDFKPLEIYEAKFLDVKFALEKSGSIARNVRGSLSISKFKSIGIKVWPDNPD